jgi:hypothetical protein
MHGYPPTEYQWIGESYLRHVPHLIQAFKEKAQREKTTQTLKRKAPRRWGHRPSKMEGESVRRASKNAK